MAKRGCRRLDYVIFSLAVLLVSSCCLFGASESSKGTDWHQSTDSDFSTGVFSNTEMTGKGDPAYVGLSRLNEWAKMTGTSAPPPRENHQMVYDNKSNVFVLFGGRNETDTLGDTWLYYTANDTWIQVFPANPPTPRFGHAMVYDYFDDIVILFGGNDGADVLSDTYVYSTSGNTWTNMNPGNAPSKRERHEMIYDSNTNQVVLFGGSSKVIPLGDTWTFSVSLNDWVELFPQSSPFPRYGHSMVYDANADLTILNGGSSGADVYNGTWVYDSGQNNWSQSVSFERPTNRRGHSMVYNPRTGPTLFGGWENSDTGASEQWDVLGCTLAAGKKFTTLTRYGDYLYIGSADLGGDAWIYRYSTITGICEPWNNTNDYFVYAAYVYDGYLFFGTRNNTVFAEGNLFYTNGTGLYHIPGDIWWRPDRPGLTVGGWIQDFEVYNGKMFVSGSTMVSSLPSKNNFFVKACNLAPCTSNSSWSWTNTSKNNLDILDDALSFEIFENNLYLGTYDYAEVLRYYPGNDTWWLSLNGSIDGPRLKGGRGIYTLIEYDGCLHAFTLKEGWNWTLCQTSGTWVGQNVTRYGSFVRGVVFRDRIYISANQSGTQVIAIFNGTDWSESLSIPGNDNFLYMAEFDGSIFATAGDSVYRKRVIQNDLWTYDTSGEIWSQIEPTNALPSPRQGHVLTYDEANDVLVLFGGRNESTYLSDVWVFSRSTPNGVYTSPTVDTAVDGLPTFWGTISWEPLSQISETELKFQIASNNDSATWVYRGPDGSSGSYYDNPTGEQIWSGHQGNRYLRYRAYLSTSTPLSPKLESVTISYFRPPYSPTLTSPNDGIWTNDSQPEFHWTFVDPDLSDSQAAFQVLIDDVQSFSNIDYESGMIMSGVDQWQPATSLEDGLWFWTVRTMDNNGAWSELSEPRVIMLDTNPPSSSITNFTSGNHLNTLESFMGISNDDFSGPDNVEISIRRHGDDFYWDGSGWQDGEHWLPCEGNSSWNFNSSSVGWVSETQYTVTTKARDTAGNSEVPGAGVAFVFDSTAPSVSLLDPIGGESPEGGKDIEIRWTASDPYLNQTSINISYSTDGGTSWNSIVESEWNDGSHNWTLPRMQMEMRIRVEAEDLAGNIGSDMSDVIYVRAPPRDEDWLSDYWWVILLIIIIVSAALTIYYWKRRSEEAEEEPIGPPPIISTAGETTLCAVCLGTVKEGLSVIKCGECGKTFHEKCAARIEKCPNCDSKLDLSELTEE